MYKACDVGEYIDYKHCKCRKKLVDKLVDACTETIEEVKLAKMTVLFWIFFTINVGGIGAYFIYFRGYLRNRFTHETTIC